MVIIVCLYFIFFTDIQKTEMFLYIVIGVITSFELSYQSSFRLVFELGSGDIVDKGKLLCL